MDTVSVTDEDSVEVTVENIGGIDETQVSFSPGITVLVGRNATNRTSLLKSVMAALGSERVPLKADAESGTVVCELEGRRYSRRVTKRNGTTVTEGNPFSGSNEAELFAFLLESNEARRAVVRGDDLRPLVLEPIDTTAIRRDISELTDRRDQIDEQLEERKRLETERLSLIDTREGIEDELEEKRARLDRLQVDSMADLTDESLVEHLSESESVRKDLDEIEFDMETVEESIDALEREREGIHEQLEDIDAAPDPAELDSRIDALRRERQELDSKLNDLQRIITFNQRQLESAETASFRTGRDDDPTSRLLDEETVCWTCGSAVESDAIKSTIDELRAYRTEVTDRRDSLESELTSLRERRDELAGKRSAEERFRSRLDEIDDAVDRRTAKLEALTSRRDELERRLAALENSSLSAESDLLEARREASQLEVTIAQLESELESIEQTLAETDDRIDELANAEARRTNTVAEIRKKREWVTTIENQLIESFNEHMDSLLTLLSYDRIERIWLERTTVDDSPDDIVDDASFELHIVRASSDGAVFEDTIDNLSESEREITGLVFAIAGYLAHEVYEEVPFVILDSLEAIDSERIAILIEYLGEFAPYLLVALLPEDAHHVDADTTITDI